MIAKNSKKKSKLMALYSKKKSINRYDNNKTIIATIVVIIVYNHIDGSSIYTDIFNEVISILIIMLIIR